MDPQHARHDHSCILRTMYARHWLLGPAACRAIPEDGMSPSRAYDLIRDELIVDGSSRFNLATFCGTWMEPEAVKLLRQLDAEPLATHFHVFCWRLKAVAHNFVVSAFLPLDIFGE